MTKKRRTRTRRIKTRRRKTTRSEKTDPPPLHKDDTASADSRTHSLSLSSAEKEEQNLSLALVRMEKAIQEHATGEPDWENADWAWARIALLVDILVPSPWMKERICAGSCEKKFEGPINWYPGRNSNLNLKLQC